MKALLHSQKKGTRFGLTETLIAVTLVASGLLLSSCEDPNASAIEAAQSCLNEMNDSMTQPQRDAKAAQCRALLAGATSEKAKVIECSSYFLQEGFFTSKIFEAFDRMEASNTDNDALNVMSVFAFQSASNASAASEACSQTGLEALQIFANLVEAATAISEAFGFGGLTLDSNGIPTSGSFETALDDLLTNGTPQEQAALGTAIVSLVDAMCVGSSDSGFSTDVCPKIEAITAGATNQEVGQCIAFCLQNVNTGNGTACASQPSITCP